jgi:hypothetical protein
VNLVFVVPGGSTAAAWHVAPPGTDRQGRRRVRPYQRRQLAHHHMEWIAEGAFVIFAGAFKLS